MIWNAVAQFLICEVVIGSISIKLKCLLTLFSLTLLRRVTISSSSGLRSQNSSGKGETVYFKVHWHLIVKAALVLSTHPMGVVDSVLPSTQFDGCLAVSSCKQSCRVAAWSRCDSSLSSCPRPRPAGCRTRICPPSRIPTDSSSNVCISFTASSKYTGQQGSQFPILRDSGLDRATLGRHSVPQLPWTDSGVVKQQVESSSNMSVSEKSLPCLTFGALIACWPPPHS